MNEVEKLTTHLRGIYPIDPCEERDRVEKTKGGLFPGSCDWFFDIYDIWAWRFYEPGQLLWVKGNSGRGKTMLRCGIISELEAKNCGLPYFFCRAADSRMNNATAVLRGLHYILIQGEPQLYKHVTETCFDVRPPLAQEANSFKSVKKGFTRILA